MIAAMEQAQRAERAFEVVLPRLAAAYHSGKLVPFIGAGMSVPRAVGWQTLVEGLEERLVSDGADATATQADSDDLIRCANAAAQALRAGAFVDALRAALFSPAHSDIPGQTLALAHL